MFQDFDNPANPLAGPARLSALRAALKTAGFDGFIVPRADAHQGEYVPQRDARLAWLTGFTGSAGFCVVLPEVAGVFIDGRYRVQVHQQVDGSAYTAVPWPEVKAGAWIKDHLASGKLAVDAWLHSENEIRDLQASLQDHPVEICFTNNFVDSIWEDRPPAPASLAVDYPAELAGLSRTEKCENLAQILRAQGLENAVLTLPDSICWLLNIRGNDVPRVPVINAFAIANADGKVALFTQDDRFPDELRSAFGAHINIHPPEDFTPALSALKGPTLVDPNTAPLAVIQILEAAGIPVKRGDDPCRLPKARKTSAEIAATREAHLRDGAAVVQFLAWLDETAPKQQLTEIDVVEALEGFRRNSNALRDLSFDTISGSGPNGAVIHYRVTHESNRSLQQGELLLVDSGAQYLDGTTDITRTMPIGPVGVEEARCYTLVLQGLIAISRARWPKGLAGRDLDALARAQLWAAGLDYDHGTGHGVGAYLSVHEGPQRLSRASEVPLEVGMILSNEPGYYREGAFGIRLENLITVREAPMLAGGDTHRKQLCFETLTFVPFDRRLIVTEMLSPAEREWINAYHLEVCAKILPISPPNVHSWLEKACAAL